MYEFLRRGPRMARVDAALYGYRQRGGSIAHGALDAEAVEGYANVMRRLAAAYGADPRLPTLRRGEFVFLAKYIVRGCGGCQDPVALRRCRVVVGELLSEGTLRLRDFGLRWGWRIFRFARRPGSR